jgi:hypothetical protein
VKLQLPLALDPEQHHGLVKVAHQKSQRVGRVYRLGVGPKYGCNQAVVVSDLSKINRDTRAAILRGMDKLTLVMPAILGSRLVILNRAATQATTNSKHWTPFGAVHINPNPSRSDRTGCVFLDGTDL